MNEKRGLKARNAKVEKKSREFQSALQKGAEEPGFRRP
jgi:hypothetical protein